MQTDLSVTTSLTYTSVVVTVAGEVDLHTADVLRDHAVAAAGRDEVRLVLDLTGVGFMDSVGIGVLVLLRRKVAARHGELHVVPSRRVRAALRLSGLDTVLTLHPSVAAALDDEVDEPA